MEPSTSTKSSIITGKTTKLVAKIDLIGNISDEIVGIELPTNRQVLQVFFHNTRNKKMIQRKAASSAVTAALNFWQQAGIPTKYHARCIEKLLKLVDTWKSIQKSVPSRRVGRLKEKEELFVSKLDELFDIAKTDALETMENPRDRQFLKSQRQKGRSGCLTGVETAKKQPSPEISTNEQLQKGNNIKDECVTIESEISTNEQLQKGNNIKDECVTIESEISTNEQLQKGNNIKDECVTIESEISTNEQLQKGNNIKDECVTIESEISTNEQLQKGNDIKDECVTIESDNAEAIEIATDPLQFIEAVYNQ